VRARHAVLLAALAALALSAQPAAARKAPLPYLDVSGVTWTPYAFQGEPASQVQFCDTTNNLGKGDTPRRLHNAMVVQGPGTSEVVARRDVPKLRGTLHARRHRHFSHHGCGRGENMPLNLPLGAYDVFVCTDQKIKQRDHAQNCVNRDKAFFVIKRSWSGTVSGENKTISGGALGNDAWQVPSVTYSFAGATQPSAGQFTYNVSAGSVNYQVSGTDDQGECSGAGGATLNASNGELKMDYKAGHYSIFGEVPLRSTVPAVITCPNGSTPVQAPIIIRFLTNGLESGFTSALPFGHTVLSGAYQQNYGGVTAYQDTWSLH